MLRYSIITPVRNEADTLPRLAEALRRQTEGPEEWVIVESGSTDRTVQVARTIAEESGWVRLLVLPATGPRERGAPIVRSLHAGFDALERKTDVIVSVDADVTMEPGYFERLLQEFERNPALGIASGSAWELEAGAWRQRFVTGGTVWGATRAYRTDCLREVLPFEARHGWDGIDQLKARARGWETRTFNDLPFRHHRSEGAHDGSTWNHWFVNGETAYFMGYRPWYLVARALHNIRHDRAAAGLVAGFLCSAARRSPRLTDPGARRVLRADQHLLRLSDRRREALGFGPRRRADERVANNDRCARA